MPLYQWDSELLKQYANGYILVVADSVEQARQMVVADFDNWVQKHREWDWADAVGAYGGEPDRTEYDKLLATLRSDIQVEPTILTGVQWMFGSA